MPVTECKYDHPTDKVGIDERNIATATLRYRIISDTDICTYDAINQAQGVGPNPIPAFWSTYNYLGFTDDTIYMRSVQAERDGQHKRRFFATCTWSAEEPGEDNSSGGGFLNVDPLQRPPVWQGDAETFTFPVDQDNTGEAILNSAGRPFDPGLERELAWPVAVVTKNYATLAEVFNLMRVMVGAVNDRTWQGQEERSVKCTEVRPEPQFTEGSARFYPVSFRFVFSADGKKWDDEIVDKGIGYLQTPGNFTSYKGTDDGSEVLLNPDGTKKEDGLGLTLTFRTAREVNFLAVLGF